MHYDNGFELLIVVVFIMIPQRGGLGPKSQDLVTPFHIGEGQPLSGFHLRALAIRSEIVLMRYQTGHTNKLTGKYTTEMSKLKHLQRYMTSFEL